MAGQVDAPTKKRRAAELLAVAAEARARWAAAHVGADVEVLFEHRLADGRWVGHAADHTLVAAAADRDADLENAIGRVRVDAIDPAAPDRVVGRIRSLSQATMPGIRSHAP
jgi:tRNA A37 methylthiotransferase MiaB